MSTLQAVFLGVMLAWTPSAIIFAIALWRGPGLREDQEMPR